MRNLWEKLSTNYLLKEFVLFSIAFLIVYVSWYEKTLYPVRLFAVFFHEASHALTTAFTGGRISEFVVRPNISGYVQPHGGNYFLIASAGYVGTSFFGCLIYMMTALTKLDRWIMAAIGLLVGGITIYFPAGGFAVFTGVLITIVFLALGRFAPAVICDVLLRIFGILLMIRPISSLYRGVIKGGYIHPGNPPPFSDAHIISEYYWGTPSFWAFVWISIIAVMIAITFYICWKRPLKKAKLGVPESPIKKKKTKPRSLGDMV